MIKIRGKSIEVIEVEFRRNPSWRESVMLGFQASIYWAPTTLMRVIGHAGAAVITGIGLIAAGSVVWALSRVFILCAGLCGRICRKAVRQ